MKRPAPEAIYRHQEQTKSAQEQTKFDLSCVASSTPLEMFERLHSHLILFLNSLWKHGAAWRIAMIFLVCKT